ncbi:hypothetical protein T439DRAFT_384466 [Meredithblackwellia eburnea MCA 4105]
MSSSPPANSNNNNKSHNPPPPPPRRVPPSIPPRPPPATYQPATSTSKPLAPTLTPAPSVLASMAAAPTTTNTGHFLRARAFNKANQLWNQANEYAGPKVENARRKAEGLRDDIREREAIYHQQQQGNNAGSTRNVGRQGSIDSFASTSTFTSTIDETPPQLSSASSSSASAMTATASSAKEFGKSIASKAIGGFGVLTNYYFNPREKERRDAGFYKEERIVGFPGYATLRPSPHTPYEPALKIDIHTSGYIYRLRPLSQASRSQRVFYSLAKSFAALPRIPGDGGSTESLSGTARKEEGEVDVEEMVGVKGKGEVFEKLLEIGGREGERSEVEELGETVGETVLDEVRSGNGSGNRAVGKEGIVVEEPESMLQQPSLSSSVNSTASSSSFLTEEDLPSQSSLPPPPPHHHHHPSLHDTHVHFPLPFTFTTPDLPRLHHNLQTRLVPFFGQKIQGRKVRVEVFGRCTPSSSSSSSSGKENGEEGEGELLASRTVTTGAGGGFRTDLEVRPQDLGKLLSGGGGKGQGRSLDDLKLSLRCSLLSPDPLPTSSSSDTTSNFSFIDPRDAKPTATDENEVNVGSDQGWRVVSDVDDTIKWTEVLRGTKTIFRNVFVREVEEIRVPGMMKWYKAMEKLGVGFHYVSNSPWELWPVIKTYLTTSGFPLGSVTLKEYGGASSAIAKLWEEPGMRKRAGVENIIREFKSCRFILIGDSGEQDLNLYVSLAQQYPDQIRAIFIRDVTTPFKPNAHPSAGFNSSSRPPTRPTTPTQATTSAFSAMSDVPGQFEPSSTSTPTPTSPTHSNSVPLPTRPPNKRTFSKDSLKSTFLRRTPSSSSLSTSPLTPTTALYEPNTDPLSPNNPLRPTSTPNTEENLILAFYERVREAERVLPQGVRLRIFRHGRECEEEAVKLVERGEWD